MLEDDIREVYQRMNDMDLPPSRVSVPAARTRGRVRLRWRRASAVGAPAFAASAVAVIALAGTLLTGSAKPAQAPGRHAPSRFSSLRPYAWFENLTRRQVVDVEELNPAQEVLLAYPRSALANSGGLLVVRPAGACHVRAGELRCSNAGPAAVYISGRLGQRAGIVDGSPAYWRQSASGGLLRWQYAPGAWAALSDGTLREALQESTQIRFGPKVAPPVRFPFRLTGVPASWRVGWVTGYWGNGVLYDTWAIITTGRTAVSPTALPPTDIGPAPVFAAFPLPLCGGVTRKLAGRTVALCDSYHGAPHILMTSLGRVRPSSPVTLQIRVGANPAIGLVDLFEHHLRLFGPNPEHWTTLPIG